MVPLLTVSSGYWKWGPLTETLVPRMLKNHMMPARPMFQKAFICKIWGYHCSGYEDFCLLGYNTMYSVNFQQTSRRYIPEYRTLHTRIFFFFLQKLSYRKIFVGRRISLHNFSVIIFVIIEGSSAVNIPVFTGRLFRSFLVSQGEIRNGWLCWYWRRQSRSRIG
jgi:hypothetical protein